LRLPIPFRAPFDLPTSARQTGLNPLRAFPAWLSPANYLPIPFALRALIMLVVWVAATLYTYNTYVVGFIGAQPVSLDLSALLFLAAVFFLGRIGAYVLMVTLVVMILRSLTAVSFLGGFYSPIGLFILILWLLAFSGQPEQTPDRIATEVHK
jgi:hypothetical protein